LPSARHGRQLAYFHVIIHPRRDRMRLLSPRRACLVGLVANLGLPAHSNAAERGLGLNLVSAYVYRDSARSGPALQPSAWAYIERAHTLFSVWSSVRLRHPRVDDVVVDARTGFALSSWGWLGGTIHWDWSTPAVRSTRSHSLELGTVLTWFTPPYRPTLALAYDAANPEGVLAAVSVPYTVRLQWLYPTTFVPELGLQAGGHRGTLSVRYFSFAALMERKTRWFTIVPMAGVVPRRGKGFGGWIVWGGAHLGANL